VLLLLLLLWRFPAAALPGISPSMK
jgi:hypothetical protein